MSSPTVVDVKLGPVHREIMRATERFLDVEGAMRSAKTWTCLMKERRKLDEHPGMHSAMGMWREDDLHQKLVPDWRNVCELMQVFSGEWNSRESCLDFPNGSRMYVVHLKTSETVSRFAAVRGLTVARLYLSQLEEVPEDVARESMLRLSQPGFPQQFTGDANPVHSTHWIAREWPDNPRLTKPDHRYIRATIWDNRHNLDPATITAAESLYPVGHPQRRTKLEGKRGLDVSGTPVYSEAFQRARHVRELTLDPGLPLCEAYDYGYHHPCVVWYQWAPWGWLRLLGGVMASDMHLDAFLPVVERYRGLWFPNAHALEATGDPAGANQNSQGLRGTPVGLINDWYREHGQRDAKGQPVVMRVLPDANHPERRFTANQIAATYMRRHVNGDEAFLVDPERWVLAELGDERQDSFMLDGLEVGYVLEAEPRHSSKLGTFWVPKKDGFYEHPNNCLEYGVLKDVRDLPLAGQRAAEAIVRHDVQRAREELAALRAQQRDRDPADALPHTRARRTSGFRRRA